ncbi:MAG: hypothetical protein IKN12_05270 [Selenomonadaceae bacterium]|nr:hypothetical protein [Selenomonadaceae bacterium]
MTIEYLPQHIKEAVMRIKNRQEDFKSAVLEISPEFNADTTMAQIKSYVLHKADENEEKRIHISVIEASTDLIKTLHSYLHRLGVDKLEVILGQARTNMKLHNESGLKEDTVKIIPYEDKSELTSLEVWFSIIDEQIRHTINLGYDFGNIPTDQLQLDLCSACGNTVTSICSLVFASGVTGGFTEFDNASVYEDEDFISL